MTEKYANGDRVLFNLPNGEDLVLEGTVIGQPNTPLPVIGESYIIDIGKEYSKEYPYQAMVVYNFWIKGKVKEEEGEELVVSFTGKPCKSTEHKHSHYDNPPFGHSFSVCKVCGLGYSDFYKCLKNNGICEFDLEKDPLANNCLHCNLPMERP